MEDIELVEKIVIRPDESTPNKRMFLSNIDLTLVAYQDSASFFDPPSSQMSFSEICNKLYCALRQMLVHYDFIAGRLVPSSEDDDRFEIDCNGAGIVVAAAKIDKKLSEFGDISVSNPKLKQLVCFLHQEDEEIDLKDMPLSSLQLTQFGCGSLALASHYNHCTLDGVAISDFEKNLAALTRGDNFKVIPNADRTFLRARNPLKISHPHHEYSKPTSTDDTVFTCRCTSNINIAKPRPKTENKVHVLHLSAQEVSSFKKNAMVKNNTLKNISSFQVVAVRIWKARSIAMKMPEEEISTMLFPIEVRKWVMPELKEGFAGNALVPGFARATVKELKEQEDGYLIRKVQEGIERIDEAYVRSGIDWLEENRGVPCSKNSFSLVAWWKLGLEDQEFGWGRLKCATPLELKPGLVMMLPGTEGEGGLHICLDLPEDQMQEFCRIILEV